MSDADGGRGRRLAGQRVALVTGAAGGLGRAIADRLETDGWRVARATHRDGPLAGDLSRPAAAGSLVERVLAAEGRLDLLVANHAAMEMGAVDELPLERWWRIVDTNLSGSFRLVRAAAAALAAARGAVILVASEWGITGWSRASAYAASKAGLIGLTKALALELAPAVRVNALAPGVVDTPQLRVDAEDAGLSLAEIRRRYALEAPLGRIATPDEIAGSVVFLASADAAYYTGQVLGPNGGTTRP